MGGFWIISGYFSSDSYTPEELNSMLQNKNEKSVSIQKVSLKEHRLSSPYVDKLTLQSDYWEFKGNAIIQNDRYIKLTSDNPHLASSVFSKKPILSKSFEMELTFSITSDHKFVADGMAIWLVDQISEIGDVFGATNYFNGLGIFIDTYRNGNKGRFPFVNLMLGDGRTFYNKENDGVDTRLAGCREPKLLNPQSGISKARIIYIDDGYFSLDFKADGEASDWKNCVTLTNVKLPSTKFLGFSAETGDLTENVNFIECVTYGLYRPDGPPILAFSELGELMRDQDENDQVLKSDITKTKSTRRRKKISNSKRKSLRRLKNSEKRIKEKEKEYRRDKYGDEETHFIHYAFYQIIRAIKVATVIVVSLLLLWAILIIYRIQREKKGPKKSLGLLD